MIKHTVGGWGGETIFPLFFIDFFILLYQLYTFKINNVYYRFLWSLKKLRLFKVCQLTVVQTISSLSACRRWAVVFSPMTPSSPTPSSVWMKTLFSQLMRWVNDSLSTNWDYTEVLHTGELRHWCFINKMRWDSDAPKAHCYQTLISASDPKLVKKPLQHSCAKTHGRTIPFSYSQPKQWLSKIFSENWSLIWEGGN